MSSVFVARDAYEAVSKACQNLNLPIGQMKLQIQDLNEHEVQAEVLETYDTDRSEELYAKQRNEVVAQAQSLFSALGYHVQVKAHISDLNLVVDIEGEDLPDLHGSSNDKLGDLQYVLMRYYYAAFPHAFLDIKCDINGSRQNREKVLTEMALAAAEKIKGDGDFVVLEPMNSFERRVVHMALQDNPQLKTVSEGHGSMKKVKIFWQTAEVSS